MNREQAKAKMKEGEKLTHYYFSPEEWVSYKDGKVLTEEDYLHDWDEFWSHREDEYFDDNWSLYGEEDPLGIKHIDTETFMLTNPYFREAGFMLEDWAKDCKPLKRGHYEGIRKEAKISNNSQCTCGSGKKYKRCCKQITNI